VAPEVLKQTEYDGFKSDMWSCGVMLYVMLAGRLPFFQKVLAELVMKIKAGEYKMPDTILPEAADLVTNMLNVDPDTRYTVHDVCAHPWFRRGGWDDSCLECSPVKEDAAAPIDHVDDDAKSPSGHPAEHGHFPPPIAIPEGGLMPALATPSSGDSPNKSQVAHSGRSPHLSPHMPAITPKGGRKASNSPTARAGTVLPRND
jgi:serine/threonine protein kinase